MGLNRICSGGQAFSFRHSVDTPSPSEVSKEITQTENTPSPYTRDKVMCFALFPPHHRHHPRGLPWSYPVLQRPGAGSCRIILQSQSTDLFRAPEGKHCFPTSFRATETWHGTILSFKGQAMGLVHLCFVGQAREYPEILKSGDVPTQVEPQPAGSALMSNPASDL